MVKTYIVPKSNHPTMKYIFKRNVEKVLPIYIIPLPVTGEAHWILEEEGITDLPIDIVQKIECRFEKFIKGIETVALYIYDPYQVKE